MIKGERKINSSSVGGLIVFYDVDVVEYLHSRSRLSQSIFLPKYPASHGKKGRKKKEIPLAVLHDDVLSSLNLDNSS